MTRKPTLYYLINVKKNGIHIMNIMEKELKRNQDELNEISKNPQYYNIKYDEYLKGNINAINYCIKFMETHIDQINCEINNWNMDRKLNDILENKESTMYDATNDKNLNDKTINELFDDFLSKNVFNGNK